MSAAEPRPLLGAPGNPTRMSSTSAHHWNLDPAVTFLNHGSFGATPRAVLAIQDQLRADMESEPVRFMVERLEPLLDNSRRVLARFVGAAPEDLVFVPNATAAVNAVVRSLRFAPGDELLTINHGYNACINVLREAADRSGARVVVAEVEPFPDSPRQLLDAFVRHCTPRTKLAMVCHVTSPTALLLPIEEIVGALQSRGVEVLVDGAHGPGMHEVHLDRLGAAYYTANCHKWLCSPKGSAFLHVRRDRQPGIRPHIISHGANSTRTDRSRFLLEFDWTGTIDPTPALCIPAAIDAMAKIWRAAGSPATVNAELKPAAVDQEAWAGIRVHNHDLALFGRRAIADSLGSPLTVPDTMIGSTASVPLPNGSGDRPPPNPYPDPAQRRLIDELGIQVPISHFPGWPRRLIRVSAQLYNSREQYARLAEVLPRVLRDSAG